MTIVYFTRRSAASGTATGPTSVPEPAVNPFTRSVPTRCGNFYSFFRTATAPNLLPSDDPPASIFQLPLDRPTTPLLDSNEPNVRPVGRGVLERPTMDDILSAPATQATVMHNVPHLTTSASLTPTASLQIAPGHWVRVTGNGFENQLAVALTPDQLYVEEPNPTVLDLSTHSFEIETLRFPRTAELVEKQKFPHHFRLPI
ncbi:hypothetical protein R3P38DRAFT_2792067 [Favolaschia claudopus]|uniref:IPT/TIG domain-containing protein n=1 Tax=Favolaschia claudopus TaxID=2862362 RepID=A0AAW0AHK2_9AGAR